MKASYKIAIGTVLAAIISFAQPRPNTYTGDIVNANCMQAAQIISRNSRGYVPPGGLNSFTGDRYKALHTAGMRKTILHHCPVNPGTTAFALLNDDGNFFRLNEAGNLSVLSQTTTVTKKIRVTITGFVDGDTLNVESLSK